MPVNRLHMYQVHGGIEGENTEYDQERGAFSDNNRMFCQFAQQEGGRLLFLSRLGRYEGFVFFREFHDPNLLAEKG